MEKGTESLLWQIAVGVGGAVAGFSAAFKRLRGLPKTVNGHGLAIMAIEAEVKRIITQLRQDMDATMRNNREAFEELLDKVRTNTDDIREMKRRMKRIEEKIDDGSD